MEQRVSLITLGVAELDRARRFYEEVLGWRAANRSSEVVFFDLGGLVLALWGHAELAADMGGAVPAGGGGGFALAHNLRSREEVDALFAVLRERGATIDRPPEATAWGGYSGYFSDPDGHRWEVAFNPFWTVEADGRISMSPPGG